MLNEKVLPFFEEHDCPIVNILADKGREYCRRMDGYPFELFMQLENIERRTNQVRGSHSNGLVERLYRTLLDEHFRIQGRMRTEAREFYESLDEIQSDLDNYLHEYNYDRAHQGRNMNGRTLTKPSLKVFLFLLVRRNLSANYYVNKVFLTFKLIDTCL